MWYRIPENRNLKRNKIHFGYKGKLICYDVREEKRNVDLLEIFEGDYLLESKCYSCMKQLLIFGAFGENFDFNLDSSLIKTQYSSIMNILRKDREFLNFRLVELTNKYNELDKLNIK